MKSDEVMITLPPKLYEQIEEDVSKLHIDLELSIPINPIDIAHRLGFIVKYYSEIVNNDEDFNLLSKDKTGIKEMAFPIMIQVQRNILFV